MEKMWTGRTDGKVNKAADDFNSSISFDSRMYRQDISGSLAHAAMLCHQGIITEEDYSRITEGLTSILSELDDGTLAIDRDCEDIHMFIEAALTARIGDSGKKLHTARSRNDQVALDLRLYLREKCDVIVNMLTELVRVICRKARSSSDAIMPGYTHLQRAQPVTFAHHIMAYAMMFSRDVTRIRDARARMNFSPLGSCALAGTTYNTDREMTARQLGFDGICENSIDGVSDRDYCIELLSALSLIMMHLSRFSEEIILWSSWEFRFVELDDAYTTGSSIMPQKKNSDMAELCRGKSGRVYGDLVSLLTMLKGLPLAYNKDMQEDKEAVFDGVDTVMACLEVFTTMIDTMRINRTAMLKAAQEGFINATDLADYIAKKGMPFRSAYKLVGQIVRYCIENNKVLEDMSIEEYRNFSPVFDEELYEDISLEACVAKRCSTGGTAPSSLERQIGYIQNLLGFSAAE